MKRACRHLMPVSLLYSPRTPKSHKMGMYKNFTNSIQCFRPTWKMNEFASRPAMKHEFKSFGVGGGCVPLRSGSIA
jgi:hypothetical protein